MAQPSLKITEAVCGADEEHAADALRHEDQRQLTNWMSQSPNRRLKGSTVLVRLRLAIYGQLDRQKSDSRR